LDVGANIGYTAALFAKVVSSGFQVIAFEPEAKNYAMLKNALVARRINSIVTPVRAAVGDFTGTADLWINPKHHADHRIGTSILHSKGRFPFATQKVPVIRLDDYWAENLREGSVRFIKIDVQGYEESVCRGMNQILSRNPNLIVGLEFYPKGIESFGF